MIHVKTLVDSDPHRLAHRIATLTLSGYTVRRGSGRSFRFASGRVHYAASFVRSQRATSDASHAPLLRALRSQTPKRLRKAA